MADREWSRFPAGDAPGKSRLAREWASAVAPHAAAPMPRAEIELHLRAHLERLHDALLAEPADPAPAAALGESLVALGLTPAALEATVVVLADRLLVDLGLDEVTFAGALHRLLGALARGYARALAAGPG